MVRTNLKKRALALAMAVAMVMGTATAVYAEDPALDTTTESGGEAGVEYYENNIYSLTMPTTAYADKPFTIDPQGVLSITQDGDEAASAALGSVVPNFIGTIKNASAFGVDVTYGLYITSDLQTGAASTVTLQADNTGLATATTNSMFLQMVTTANITDTDLTTLSAKTKDYQLISDGAWNGTAYPIVANGKTNGMEVTFTLGAAEYILTKSGSTYGWSLDSNNTDNYSQVAFAIGGEVAQKADWSDYGAGEEQESIALKIVYSLKKNTTAATVATVTSTNVAATAPTYLGTNDSPAATYATVSEDGLSATITDVTVATNTTTDVAFDFDFGKAGKKATLIGMYLGQGTDSLQLVEGTHYETTATGFKLLDSVNDGVWVLDYANAGNTISIGVTDCDGNELWFNITFNTVVSGS